MICSSIVMGSSSVFRPPLMAFSSVVPPSKKYAWGGGRINPPSSIRLRSNCCNSIAIGTSTHDVVNYSDERTAAVPWLMVPSTGGDRAYSFYSLADKKVVNLELKGLDRKNDISFSVMGSSDGFLVLLNQKTNDIFLYNPISGRRIELPFTIRFSSKISDGTIRFSSKISDGTHSYVEEYCKVVISENERRAMMMFGPRRRIAFCSNPSSSIEWTELEPKLSGYTDIVYSKLHKMFMCMADRGVEEWDLRRPRKPNNVERKIKNWDLRRPHKPKNVVGGFEDVMMNDACNKEYYVVFVEHLDQLYVVTRFMMKRVQYLKNRNRVGFPVREDWDEDYATKTIGFDVHKVVRVGSGNDVELKLCMEGSLDNLVMFIGVNHSFALPANDYPELKPDSIYFTDHPRHLDWDWNKGVFDTPHDTAIYNFNDRTFCPLDYPNHVLTGPTWRPLWFTPSPN